MVERARYRFFIINTYVQIVVSKHANDLIRYTTNDLINDLIPYDK